MIKRLSSNWILILMLLALLAVWAVVGRLSTPNVHAAVNRSAFNCTPFDVGVWIQRVHVRCTTTVNIGGNVISWWAYPTSDSAGASRFLSLFETAKATGTTLTLYYDAADLSGSTFGCGSTDCRRIWGATSP
jgi:hypothetical protein